MKNETRNHEKSSKAIEASDLVEIPNAIDVYGWSPEPPGTMNARMTQVHVHFGTSIGHKLMIRFKGPDTLDALIEALQEHRQHVWGKP